MSTIECPKCLTKVYPTKDGICPSCKEKIDLNESVNQIFTSLEIHEFDKKPELCFNCGKVSDSSKTFNKKTKLGGDHWLVNIIALLASGMISWIPTPKDDGQKLKTKIKLPVCSQCLRQNKNLGPTYIDFYGSKMMFKVHKRFKAEFELLNKIKTEHNNGEHS